MNRGPVAGVACPSAANHGSPRISITAEVLERLPALSGTKQAPLHQPLVAGTPA